MYVPDFLDFSPVSVPDPAKFNPESQTGPTVPEVVNRVKVGIIKFLFKIDCLEFLSLEN